MVIGRSLDGVIAGTCFALWRKIIRPCTLVFVLCEQLLNFRQRMGFVFWFVLPCKHGILPLLTRFLSILRKGAAPLGHAINSENMWSLTDTQQTCTTICDQQTRAIFFSFSPYIFFSLLLCSFIIYDDGNQFSTAKFLVFIRWSFIFKPCFCMPACLQK